MPQRFLRIDSIKHLFIDDTIIREIVILSEGGVYPFEHVVMHGKLSSTQFNVLCVKLKCWLSASL